MDSNQITPINSDERQMAAPLQEEDAHDFAHDPTLDPLAGAQTSKKLSGGTMIIGAVVVIAIGGLYSMRLLANATAAAKLDDATEALVEKFLNEPIAEVFPEPEGGTVEEIFTHDRTTNQVRTEELRKDPMEIWGAGEKTTTPVATKNRVAELLASCQQQRTQVEQICKRLRLKSIVDGARPMALLEDQIVRVGNTIKAGQTGVKLTVKSIGSDHILIVAEAPNCDTADMDTSGLSAEQMAELDSKLAAMPAMSFRVDLKRN